MSLCLVPGTIYKSLEIYIAVKFTKPSSDRSWRPRLTNSDYILYSAHVYSEIYIDTEMKDILSQSVTTFRFKTCLGRILVQLILGHRLIISLYIISLNSPYCVIPGLPFQVYTHFVRGQLYSRTGPYAIFFSVMEMKFVDVIVHNDVMTWVMSLAYIHELLILCAGKFTGYWCIPNTKDRRCRVYSFKHGYLSNKQTNGRWIWTRQFWCDVILL